MRTLPTLQISLLRALAEFRYHLRSFLQFSEQVAQDHGLQPRQHQLLLQIAGIPEGRVATMSFLAERLGLRQNSLVELADRSVAEGLVRAYRRHGRPAAGGSLGHGQGDASAGCACRPAMRGSWTSLGRS